MSPVVPIGSPYMDQLEVIPVILIFRPVLAYRRAIEHPAEVIHLTHLLAGQNIDEVFILNDAVIRSNLDLFLEELVQEDAGGSRGRRHGYGQCTGGNEDACLDPNSKLTP